MALRLAALLAAACAVIAACTPTSHHISPSSSEVPSTPSASTATPGIDCVQRHAWRSVADVRADIFAAGLLGDCTLALATSTEQRPYRTVVAEISVAGTTRRLAVLRQMGRVRAAATSGGYLWVAGSASQGRTLGGSVLARIDPNTAAVRTIRLPGDPEYVRDLAPYGSGVLIAAQDKRLRVLAANRMGNVTTLATMPIGGSDVAVTSAGRRYYAVSGGPGSAGWLAVGSRTGSPTLRQLPPSINDPNDVVVAQRRIVVAGRLVRGQGSSEGAKSSAVVISGDGGKHWHYDTPTGTAVSGMGAQLGAIGARLFAVAARGEREFLFEQTQGQARWSTPGPAPLPNEGPGIVVPARDGLWYLAIHAYWMSYRS